MIANLLTSGLGEHTEVFENPVFIGEIEVNSGDQQMSISVEDTPLSIILQ